jgi:hypothetical protein
MKKLIIRKTYHGRKRSKYTIDVTFTVDGVERFHHSCPAKRREGEFFVTSLYPWVPQLAKLMNVGPWTLKQVLGLCWESAECDFHDNGGMTVHEDGKTRRWPSDL